MTDQSYQDHEKIQELNKSPINQKAAALLKRAKVQPDPSLLHLYQLLVWGLESGEVRCLDNGKESRAKKDLLLGVAQKLMLEHDPQRAMDLLLKQGPDEGNPQETWVDPKILAKTKDPEEAALMLTEALDRSLVASQTPDPVLEQ